jgi:hypothetical protein
MQMRNVVLAIFVMSGFIHLASAAEVQVDSIGLVGDDPSAAEANTRLLKQQVSPPQFGGTGTFTGIVRFGNSKTYYFNDVIAFKENIHMELQGSTLHFHKLAEARDQSSGFLFAIRDFSVANGKIEVDYDGMKVVHAGAAIQFGQRFSNGGIYFPKSYDSLMPAPMGNIRVSNLSITTNNPAGGCGIAMTGGLVDVTLDQVQIDGQGRLVCGIYYEFGQATPSKPDEPFYTSHAHRMIFSNISVSNLASTGDSIGIALGGAYDVLLDHVKITGAHIGIYSTAGDSAFYRPWGDLPAQRTITLKNIALLGITGPGFNLSGSDAISGGYLGRFIKNPTPEMQTDHLNFVVSDFSAEGTGGGWGIYTSGGSTQITKGRLSGFVRGIVATEDSRVIEIDGVEIDDIKQQGIQLNLGVGIWNSARQKSGYIRNCTITAGTNDAGAGSPAITVNNTSDLAISNNILNFSNPKTLAQAIYIGPTAKGVKIVGTKINH